MTVCSRSRFWRWLGSVLMALAGLAGFTACPAYGVDTPRNLPAVSLVSFSYTPASPVQFGEKVVFTTVADRITPDAYVTVEIGGSIAAQQQWANVPLNDAGVAPDVLAYDGVWTGELAWLPEYGVQSELPVQTTFVWDGYTQQLWGPALTVTEPEEDAAE